MNRRRSRRSSGGLLTILFTDIESSTARTQRMGDTQAQEMIRAHNQIVRREIAARGGTEIKHTGDGIMATFQSAARAVACAIAIQRASEAHSLEHEATAFRVSVGINAGEPVAEDADVFGAAVQLAARTCAEAKGGQILATDVVRQLVLGKGVLFREVGSSSMKGFEQPTALYEVVSADDAIDEAEVLAGPFLRRPLVWAGGAVAAALVAGGAIAAVVAMNGGEEAASGPAYETYEYRFESEFPVEISAGDCVTDDFVVTGQGAGGPVSGDFTGTVDVRFEARLSAADGCRSLTSLENAQYILGEGSFDQISLSISRHRLGDSPLVGSTTEAISAGISLRGEGSFEGTAGKLRCLSTGLSRTGATGPQAVIHADCDFKLASTGELPIAIEAVANTTSISTDRASAETPNAARIAAVYSNNTGDMLRGLTLRLREPPGVRLATRESVEGDWNEGEALFELPDLAPREGATFQFYLRIIQAENAAVTLVPEIVAEDAGLADRSSAIELTVSR
jgi:class 3 adenylate cyclase